MRSELCGKGGQVGRAGCARGRVLQEFLSLDAVSYDETVCVKTSDGVWAAAKFPAGARLNTETVTFTVTVFRP
jgi:hypothetical protein